MEVYWCNESSLYSLPLCGWLLFFLKSRWRYHSWGWNCNILCKAYVSMAWLWRKRTKRWSKNQYAENFTRKNGVYRKWTTKTFVLAEKFPIGFNRAITPKRTPAVTACTFPSGPECYRSASDKEGMRVKSKYYGLPASSPRRLSSKYGKRPGDEIAYNIEERG